ncbi:hypothetical protein GTO89_04560 [Heliobacterium gestii]|uniref:Uncharacterized protein n=1 Tax=Heliomicrobium gestii TaxID=2699 RepID=A0A845LFN7_HELGE|nr:hypothetical protein [Heliomicrobium gestii]MBM7866885.1 hypothetical protein [Heliomicrobium gestii]MZP42313.1 hypothetical protein [Heliomicrobium gestii]
MQKRIFSRREPGAIEKALFHRAQKDVKQVLFGWLEKRQEKQIAGSLRMLGQYYAQEMQRNRLPG